MNRVMTPWAMAGMNFDHFYGVENNALLDTRVEPEYDEPWVGLLDHPDEPCDDAGGGIICHEYAGELFIPALCASGIFLKPAVEDDISLGKIFTSLLPFIGLQVLVVAMLILFLGIFGHG